MSALKGLRDDVYRRPLATALDRLGIELGWRRPPGRRQPTARWWPSPRPERT